MTNYVDIDSRFDSVFVTIRFPKGRETKAFVYIPHEWVFQNQEDDFFYWVNDTLLSTNPWVLSAKESN